MFVEHAKQLGAMLAEKNITLIYGGGNIGIMGAVANAAIEKNGKVIGIIPTILTEREYKIIGTTVHEVSDMHTRKKMLYENCDGAIILPGGFGTMDEMFEIITWNQLSIHNKHIFILNSGGFYDHLILQLKKMQEENFLYNGVIEKIIVVNKPDELDL